MDDITIHGLSDEEAAPILRERSNRRLSCANGMCGGCPRCGYHEAEDTTQHEDD